MFWLARDHIESAPGNSIYHYFNLCNNTFPILPMLVFEGLNNLHDMWWGKTLLCGFLL